MTNLSRNIRYGTINCIDVYGNRLMVSQGKDGKIKFTLYHDEIVEGIARKEFEDVLLRITSDSGKIFQMTQGIYDYAGSRYISSENPIRDGRNFIHIEQESEDSYYLTIGRDLGNELNKPTQTNIELSGKIYEDLYNDLVVGEQKKLIGIKELS